MAPERPLALITDSRCLGHDTGGGLHPEIPGRLTAVAERLTSGEEALSPRLVEPRRAEWEWLSAVHDEGYLMRFEEAALSGRSYLDHSDNRLSYDSYEAALLAAGSGLTGIDLLEGESGESPFCAVRPPGHHAESSRAMGFCFINNAAVAARYWQKAHGRRRIFIIDWDAHHGNGIQGAFEGDAAVFYASLHEHPTFSFPGTGYAGERGKGPGIGTVLNCTLPPGAGDDRALAAMRKQVKPSLESFRPDGIIVAAGFDGHEKDDMSGLAYTTGLFRELGRLAATWGDACCEGRVLTLLEGGYHLESLASSVAAYLQGLTCGR